MSLEIRFQLADFTHQLKIGSFNVKPQDSSFLMLPGGGKWEKWVPNHSNAPFNRKVFK